jgi:phenylacetate-coenzyme A ligase PaaK-like adenylate-forming protein
MKDPWKIFGIGIQQEFSDLALEIFHFQAKTIPVYREFINHLGIRAGSVDDIIKIPFLPAGFFKSHEIIVPGMKPQIIFESSRTTGSIPSRHFVADTGIYDRSLSECFRHFYGNPGDYCFIVLLPSYHERPDSSLVYMAEKLITLSGDADSGFYHGDTEHLMQILSKKNAEGTPVILLGVSFALTDLAEKYKRDLPGIIFMETGGMKGRRKEIIREELHEMLRKSFGIQDVHSEYGMTELLSQAYSGTGGKYMTPPWMRILIRDLQDPNKILDHHETGCLNIIDLANVYSCSFIATSDLGRRYPDGSFEVLGRADYSDLRGCNLMADGE